MTKKTFTLAILVATLLISQAACAAKSTPQFHELPSPQPYPQPYPAGDLPVSSDDPGVPYPSPLDPLPGEETMRRGEVYLESSDLLSLESYPVQVMLRLRGNLPSACSHLRAKVNPADEQNRIYVELYALVETDKVCIDVLEPFETSLPLGSFTNGKYTVWINGKQVGEFGSS